MDYPPHLTYLNKRCILPISRDNESPFGLGNAIFGSEQGYSFWKDFIDNIFTNTELSSIKESRIIPVTGPEGLSDFYWKNKDKYKDIYLAPRNVFHPQLKFHFFIAATTKETIGIHLCWGSWRTVDPLRRIHRILCRKITALT